MRWMNFTIGHAGFAWLSVSRTQKNGLASIGYQPSIRWKYRWHRGPYITTGRNYVTYLL